MRFGMCKKSTKNDKSSTLGQQKRKTRTHFGRPGGVIFEHFLISSFIMSGAAGGSFRGVGIQVKLVEFGIGQKVLVIFELGGLTRTTSLIQHALLPG